MIYFIFKHVDVCLCRCVPVMSDAPEERLTVLVGYPVWMLETESRSFARTVPWNSVQWDSHTLNAWSLAGQAIETRGWDPAAQSRSLRACFRSYTWSLVPFVHYEGRSPCHTLLPHHWPRTNRATTERTGTPSSLFSQVFGQCCGKLFSNVPLISECLVTHCGHEFLGTWVSFQGCLFSPHHKKIDTRLLSSKEQVCLQFS